MRITAILLLAALTACHQERTPRYQIPGADAERGRALIAAAGCGGCHTIPGVRSARGMVGPPLMNFANRAFIGGQLPNQPDALVAWIRNAARYDSATVMPPFDFTASETRDIAAYLYTLGEANPLGPWRLLPAHWAEGW